MDVLFVCTANQCRSPLAEALFRARLADRGAPLTVGSAGFLQPGVPVPAEMLKVTAGAGLDLEHHRSSRLSPETVASAELVVTMTRQHLVDVILLSPGSWSRCFTFADILRRGGAIGPRRVGQVLGAWVEAAHSGRSRAGILSLDLADDVADPMGGRRSAFARTVSEIQEATARLAALVWPPDLGTAGPPA